MRRPDVVAVQAVCAQPLRPVLAPSRGLGLSWHDVNYFANLYVDGRLDWTALDGVHVRMGLGGNVSSQEGLSLDEIALLHADLRRRKIRPAQNTW